MRYLQPPSTKIHGGCIFGYEPTKKHNSMLKLRKNNPGLRFLVDFWIRYCTLEPWHEDWAREHIRVPPPLKRHEPLYLDGEQQKNVYLVAKGLLARVQDDLSTDRRHILSVALPGMALMTTHHLYSDSPTKGDIVSLRSDTRVVQIPYRSLLDFKEQEPHIDTLIDILGNKKRKQLAKLREISAGIPPFERYLHFAKEMPELYHVLTQQEMAELLGIGRNTVQRAQYFLSTGRHPQKKPL